MRFLLGVLVAVPGTATSSRDGTGADFSTILYFFISGDLTGVECVEAGLAGDEALPGGIGARTGVGTGFVTADEPIAKASLTQCHQIRVKQMWQHKILVPPNCKIIRQQHYVPKHGV